MTIRTTEGGEATSTVYVPRGAGVLGIDWSDIDAKYRTLVPLAGLADAQIEQSLARIHDFRSVTAMAEFVRLLDAPRV